VSCQTVYDFSVHRRGGAILDWWSATLSATWKAVAFTAAFAHDHSEPQDQRTILTSSSVKPYFDVPKWTAPATLIGCPATVAPVGQTKAGLPVGIQIMGPYWEDATLITFAGLLAEELGGFTAPPSYFPSQK